MTATVPGTFNVQELTSLGALGVGMRLYTYVQGTTTQKTAYTDPAASVPHTYTSDGIGGQYIGLNARGELPAPLYLTTGSYDLALKDSTGAAVWTRRADPVGDAVGTSALAITSDTPAYVQQLSTSAGEAGLTLKDQTAARRAEFLQFGTTSAGLYGIAAGMAGINTPVGVDFSIGVADAKKLWFDSATSNIGVGFAPVSGKGLLQIAGGATGGLGMGNANNTTNTTFDWYEEQTGAGAATPYTPAVKFGAGSVGITYSTQLGNFTRLGNMVFVRINFVMTNKGSSSGFATLNLPYAAASAVGSISSVIMGGFGSMVALGAGNCFALSGTPGSAVVSVVAYNLLGNSSGPISVADTSFTSGSLLDIAFSYQAA